MARSGDEPFSLYGLIAQSVEMPDDRSSITFHLRPEARFSDGTPITPEDVLFSHQILKEKGWPYHRSHYAKVSVAEKTGPHSVRFTFKSPGDREIPLIMGLLPVLPRHLLTPESFDRTTLEAPVGSGPYRVERIDPGRSVTYRRNPDWWARDLPVTRGRFNFDEIRVEYFRDAASLFEAFKAGDVHVRAEDDPGRWIEGYRFPGGHRRPRHQARVRDGPAFGHDGARVQYSPADLRGRARAPRLPAAVRRRLDQPQPVQRRLPAHAKLLRAFGALLARPPRRRPRAGAAGARSPPT